jgi:hypothetical protein
MAFPDGCDYMKLLTYMKLSNTSNIQLETAFPISLFISFHLTAFLCSLSKNTPTMSRAFDQISKVNDTKELWKLAVKVDDFWTTIKSSKEYAFQFP